MNASLVWMLNNYELEAEKQVNKLSTICLVETNFETNDLWKKQLYFFSHSVQSQPLTKKEYTF